MSRGYSCRTTQCSGLAIESSGVVRRWSRAADCYRSAMNHFILNLLICFLLVGRQTCAQEIKRVPTFGQLEAVAGTHVKDEKLAELLRDFDFSENPKRERSWGSRFGVFLEQSKMGIVSVVIRPPSERTKIAPFAGKLPKQLAAEDTVKDIKQKLGKPERVVELGDAHQVMHYNGFHIVTLDGRLFEIWLTEFEEKAEPSDRPESPKGRFSNR